MTSADAQPFAYDTATPSPAASYVIPAVLKVVGELRPDLRVLDVGCGNGALAGYFLRAGCSVVGVDTSKHGIEIARAAQPGGRFELLAADENLLEDLAEEPFDIVVSTLVVAHVYDPRSYAAGCFGALQPGGRFVCASPYHGYAKNLAIALLNRFDSHFAPLDDQRHLNFWSRATLGCLLAEAGFVNLEFRGAGRFPYLWRAMILFGDRPK